MSVRDAVFLVIGIMCGMTFVMVVSCLMLSGRISEQEYLQEVEKNMENVRKEGSN